MMVRYKIFLLCSAEATVLHKWGMLSMSQLFGTNDLTDRLDSTNKKALNQEVVHHPPLPHKLQLLCSMLCPLNSWIKYQ
jgi:hypothetical protein